MIENDLLTSIRDTEEKAKEIFENARKETGKLWKKLEEEKIEIVKKLESEVDSEIRTKKKQSEASLKQKLAEVEKEEVFHVRELIEFARNNQEKLSDKIVKDILNKVC